jgi:mRNA interferase MazF
MRRGEIWWVAQDPLPRSGTRKRRKAIIVSNDASNKSLSRVQVVPLTIRTDRVYPSEALVVCDGTESKAMADQLATISKSRLSRCVGCLSEEDMHKVIEAIKVQLDLY